MLDSVVTIFISILSLICLSLIIVNLNLWLKARSIGKNLTEFNAINSQKVVIDEKGESAIQIAASEMTQALTPVNKLIKGEEKISQKQKELIPNEENKVNNATVAAAAAVATSSSGSAPPAAVAAAPSGSLKKIRKKSDTSQSKLKSNNWQNTGVSQISSVSEDNSSDFSQNSVMETLYQDTFKNQVIGKFQRKKTKTRSLPTNNEELISHDDKSAPCPDELLRLESGDADGNIEEPAKSSKAGYNNFFQSYFQTNNKRNTSAATAGNNIDNEILACLEDAEASILDASINTDTESITALCQDYETDFNNLTKLSVLPKTSTSGSRPKKSKSLNRKYKLYP